jgi:uncharacterized protein (TIGR00730 family)
LMGILAQAVMEFGGEVIGVIPRSLEAKELAFRETTRLHIVDSMHERKALMADLADGFAALPGGFGTCDELFEILTWAQLGLHDKPVWLLNSSGFFTPLLAWLETLVEQGFVKEKNMSLLNVAEAGETIVRSVARGA